MHEWNIDGRYLSAIVAVVTAGILYFEVIEGTYYSHVEVEAFLERLRSFLLYAIRNSSVDAGSTLSGILSKLLSKASATIASVVTVHQLLLLIRPFFNVFIRN